jgi:hypothetical protein
LIGKRFLCAFGIVSLLCSATFSQINTVKSVDRQPAKVETPFVVGERLEYEVSWSSFIVAGELVLETKERRDFEGVDGFHVSALAQSVGLVNLTVLKVKDNYDSFINAATLQPFRAEKNSRRGKKRAQGSMVIDQQNGKATLEDGRSIAIPQSTYDLASLLYAIRTMDVTPGKSRQFTLLEDGKLYHLTAQVEGREKITTRTGKYDTVIISTRAANGSSEKDPYKLKIYLTTDAARLPVLIRAEPTWGEIKVELIQATGTKQRQK